jgi:hypothetical protein
MIRRPRFAPQVVDSCIDCLGWGVTRSTSWLCDGCRGWRRRISRGEGDCVTCGNRRHLNAEGLCRLCRRQTRMIRLVHKDTTAAEANRGGQQLFIVGYFRRPRTIPADAGSPLRVRAGQYPVRLLPVPDRRQHLRRGDPGQHLTNCRQRNIQRPQQRDRRRRATPGRQLGPGRPG